MVGFACSIEIEIGSVRCSSLKGLMAKDVKLSLSSRRHPKHTDVCVDNGAVWHAIVIARSLARSVALSAISISLRGSSGVHLLLACENLSRVWRGPKCASLLGPSLGVLGSLIADLAGLASTKRVAHSSNDEKLSSSRLASPGSSARLLL